MTWTKLGEEWSDAARDLPDAAYRTHVDALCWSNRRGQDLQIPKRDLKRFAETDDPDTAVKNLIAAGWWQDCGDSWFIGMQFADWQLESTVVTKRREQSALTTRRNRMHQAGDHSLCLTKNCLYLRDASRDASPDLSRERSPGTERNGTERSSTVGGEEVVWKVGDTEVAVASDCSAVAPIPVLTADDDSDEPQRALQAVRRRVQEREQQRMTEGETHS
jgi:hypothetical protein